MILDVALVLVAAALFAVLAFTPKLRQSSTWTATLTPLASIMGSGFLVCGPLLAGVVGVWTPVAMAGLLAVAYGIGGAIRFNIRELERAIEKSERPSGERDESKGDSDDAESEHRLHRGHGTAVSTAVTRAARTSQFVLAAAYIISVTYYVMLLAQFSLQPFGMGSGTAPTVLAVAVLGGLAAVGFFFGLAIIERIERYVVSANLAVIGSLLVGLAWHNISLATAGRWALPDLPVLDDRWTMVRTLMGLLIVVQGFETSRYLDGHSAAERVRTMRIAQLVSAAIYLVFLSLLLPLLSRDNASADAGVTAIIGIVGVVASVLPPLLTVVAAGSQFSAAAADEAGCGGLLERLVPKLTARTAYVVIGGATIALALLVDVMSVIALASRAFAAFYAVQCGMAASQAWRTQRRGLGIWFAVLTVIAIAVAALGIASE